MKTEPIWGGTPCQPIALFPQMHDCQLCGDVTVQTEVEHDLLVCNTRGVSNVAKDAIFGKDEKDMSSQCIRYTGVTKNNVGMRSK